MVEEQEEPKVLARSADAEASFYFLVEFVC